MAAHPGIRVEPWHRLEGAGAGGLNRMIGFRADPEVLGYILPREFTQEPPQSKNLEVMVPCRSRCGGTVVRYPLALTYVDGL